MSMVLVIIGNTYIEMIYNLVSHKRLFETEYPALQTSPPTPLLAEARGVKSSPELSSLPLASSG
jgi:hypothetical protein